MKNFKRNLLIFSVLGVLIIIGIYMKLKFNHYENNFYFLMDFNNELFGISIIGAFISGILWKIDFFKYFLISMAVVFLGFVFTYPMAKVDKTIYFENFSNTPKSIVVNGKKYIIYFLDKRLDFPYIDVIVGDENITKSGYYIVNLSYPEKYYKLGFLEGVVFNGFKFNILTMISNKVKYKIFKISNHPECFVVEFKDFSLRKGEIAYYIKGIDSNED